MPLRLFLVALAGVLLALTYEPFAFGWLLPGAVALAVLGIQGTSIRRGVLLGWVFGLVYMPILIYWMRAVATDAWIALAGFQTLYYALLGGLIAALSRRRGWPLWVAAAWVGVDAFRGSWPMSGFTWGQLGFATLDTPYAGWLPWVGLPGVSLLVAASGTAIAWVVVMLNRTRDEGGESPRFHRPRLVALSVLGATAATVVLPGLVTWQGADHGSTTVAVVQGDVPGDGTDLLAHHREVTESHSRLTQDLADQVRSGEVPPLDFVVWPENSTAVDPFADSATKAEIDAATEAVGVPVLVGAVVDPPAQDGVPSQGVLNQGIVVDPVTGGGDRYTKRHPVPFGEYIPYRDLIEEWQFSRLDEVPRDMLAGDRKDPLRVAGIDVAHAICFDVTYDDVFVDQVGRGASVIVVQTSNAMFIKTAQIDQQFAISRIRALETGRTVVVAAVNGRSGVIAPDGTVTSSIAPRTADTLVADVPLVEGTPPSMLIGPWIGRGCAAITLLVLAAGPLGYRRSHQQHPTPANAPTGGDAPGRTERQHA